MNEIRRWTLAIPAVLCLVAASGCGKDPDAGKKDGPAAGQKSGTDKPGDAATKADPKHEEAVALVKEAIAKAAAGDVKGYRSFYAYANSFEDMELGWHMRNAAKCSTQVLKVVSNEELKLVAVAMATSPGEDLRGTSTTQVDPIFKITWMDGKPKLSLPQFLPAGKGEAYMNQFATEKWPMPTKALPQPDEKSFLKNVDGPGFRKSDPVGKDGGSGATKSAPIAEDVKR